jgi:hypothetical protein
MNQCPKACESPATLVAIVVAAHHAGDRDLERHARCRLEHEFGIRLSFARSSTATAEPEEFCGA